VDISWRKQASSSREEKKKRESFIVVSAASSTDHQICPLCDLKEVRMSRPPLATCPFRRNLRKQKL